MLSATSTCLTPRRSAAPGKQSRWAPRPGSGPPVGTNPLRILSKGATMPEHHARPGLQPRHTTHPAIWAAASTGPGGHTPILTGAGSTYVAPFFATAFAKYHQQHPAVTVNYSPVGSSAGIAAISAKQVNFGASDVPMNASELAAAQGGPVTQVPDALGAE